MTTTEEEDWGVKDEDLAVGTTYEVQMADCCVSGTFTSELVEIAWMEGGVYLDRLQFANGVELTHTLGCIFKEVDL